MFVYSHLRLSIKGVHIFICKLQNNLLESTVFRCLVGHTYRSTKFLMYYVGGGSTYEGLKYAKLFHTFWLYEVALNISFNAFMGTTLHFQFNINIPTYSLKRRHLSLFPCSLCILPVKVLKRNIGLKCVKQ